MRAFGGAQPYRRHSKVAQNLVGGDQSRAIAGARSPSDFRRVGAGEIGRHSGCAVAEVDEHAAPLFLELLERARNDADAENVAENVGPMQPRRHVAAVADRRRDKGESSMSNGVR